MPVPREPLSLSWSGSGLNSRLVGCDVDWIRPGPPFGSNLKVESGESPASRKALGLVAELRVPPNLKLASGPAAGRRELGPRMGPGGTLGVHGTRSALGHLGPTVRSDQVEHGPQSTQKTLQVTVIKF
jgi:hypothetical protein